EDLGAAAAQFHPAQERPGRDVARARPGGQAAGLHVTDVDVPAGRLEECLLPVTLTGKGGGQRGRHRCDACPPPPTADRPPPAHRTSRAVCASPYHTRTA